jgi:transcriptional regulator with XRE-family HTH domain
MRSSCYFFPMTPRPRTRPSRLHQEPEAVTWARERSGLTKRALADLVGISEQLMGEIESGWRSATPANLVKIAAALNCPLVALERKRYAAADEQLADQRSVRERKDE